MAETSDAKKGMGSGAETADRTVEVLYQKLGERWFAFSLVDEDVYFGQVPDDALTGTKDAGPEPKAS